VFALTTSESIDLGVATGTALLGLATFVLAWQARVQARATRRLAETAERDFLARTVPVVRVMREVRPDQADIVTVNKGDSSERLIVRIENRGQAPAGIEQLTMSPGGIGELAVVYEAIGSGVRYRVRTRAKRDLGANDERWVILGEEPPSRLGP